MSVFGAGVNTLNDHLIVFDGGGYGSPLTAYILPTTDLRIESYNASNAAVWTTQSIPTVPFGASHIYYYGQSTVQIPGTSFVFGAMPVMADVSFDISNYALLIFHLDAVDYIDTATYQSQQNTSIDNYNCAVYNPIANTLLVIAYSCVMYDISSDLWNENIADLNIRRYSTGCAMDGSGQFAFAFGGLRSVNLYSIEEYNFGSNSWTLLDTSVVRLKEGKRYLSCILFMTFDQNIYCAGGYDDISYGSNFFYPL